MSVCTAGNSDTHHASRTTNLNLRSTPDLADTTYRHALGQLRTHIKRAVPGHVHIYCFNIPHEELERAYNLLDKQTEHKSMKITYNENFNFIIRYMPSVAHETAAATWTSLLAAALILAAPGQRVPAGCVFMGSTTYQLGRRKKQADATVRPTASASIFPSVVVEVGCSESIGQLRIDMGLWIEDCHEVQLGILLSIDPPLPPHPNFPRIRVELWRGFPPARLPCTGAHHRTREGRMVWQADWTAAASPLYILLSDIFRGQTPTAYNSDQVFLDTTHWRQQILNNYWQM